MKEIYHVRHDYSKPKLETINALSIDKACQICNNNFNTTVYDVFGRIIYTPWRGIDRRRLVSK